MIENIRYKYISFKVEETFKKCNIRSLPVDIEKLKAVLSKEKNCMFIPFSKAMEQYSLTEIQVAVMVGSFDASCNYDPTTQRYLIFYNDVDKNIIKSNRHRWNMAHEIGHMLLEHNKICNIKRLSRTDYIESEDKILEDEANHFTTLLLAHPILLSALNIKDYKGVMDHCKLSRKASKSVFKYLCIWSNFSTHFVSDFEILNHFYEYINVKECLSCDHTFIHENANYCPQCGCEDFMHGNLTNIDFNCEVNEFASIFGCPDCGNRDILSGEIYCSNCCEEIEDQYEDNEPLWIRYGAESY